MLVYVGLFMIISALSLYEMLYKNKKVVFLTFITLASFAGFRYQIGLDYKTYQSFYFDINSFTDIFNGKIDAEIGYVFLNYIFKLIGLNYQTFLLFFSFFALGLLTIYLYKNFNSPSIFLVYYFARFFFARDMGQIRGSIASIILLFAVKYILDKKIVPFIIIVLIASLFHITSLIFILGFLYIYFLPEISLKQSVISLAIAIFFGLFLQFQNLYLWAIPERYIAYFTNSFYTSGEWIMNPVLWMQLFLYFGTMFFSDVKNNKQFKLYLQLYFIASLSLLAFGNLSTVGGRLSSPFATYEIFIAPYFFMNFTKNKLVNVIMLYIFIIFIFVLIFIFSGYSEVYIPYTNLF